MKEMKIYNCKSADENPMPAWMHKGSKKKQEIKEMDLVEQFKKNPDSFFPEFLKVNK